jgi:hypothetical protein
MARMRMPSRLVTVGWRVRALSTYLGHSNLADTCRYLQATPDLLRGVADACERVLAGGAR